MFSNVQDLSKLQNSCNSTFTFEYKYDHLTKDAFKDMFGIDMI